MFICADGSESVMTPRSERKARRIETDEAGGSPQERKELDQLFSIAYEELRRLAAVVRRGDPSGTLSPTARVNEAWLKLSKSPGFASRCWERNQDHSDEGKVPTSYPFIPHSLILTRTHRYRHDSTAGMWVNSWLAG
jgi:hypothetical protein